VTWSDPGLHCCQQQQLLLLLLLLRVSVQWVRHLLYCVDVKMSVQFLDPAAAAAAAADCVAVSAAAAAAGMPLTGLASSVASVAALAVRPAACLTYDGPLTPLP
jgi:tetrahydromethanopterin S-methyltransferase subunit D